MKKLIVDIDPVDTRRFEALLKYSKIRKGGSYQSNYRPVYRGAYFNHDKDSKLGIRLVLRKVS